MAIDPQAPPAPGRPSSSVAAIENEIPTYRAVSTLAVASLLFGLISGLAFADFNFLVAAALAVGVGALALRKIRRQPDVLTGSGFAQAGIILGLAFALSSVTYTFVQNKLITSTGATSTRPSGSSPPPNPGAASLPNRSASR